MSEHAQPLPAAVRAELLGQRQFLLDEQASWRSLLNRMGPNAYYQAEIDKIQKQVDRINQILARS